MTKALATSICIPQPFQNSEKAVFVERRITMERLVVKFSLNKKWFRICTYTRNHPGKLGIFRYRRDMLMELINGERTTFLDLDGSNFCRAISALGNLNFRITFLRSQSDFDHLVGYHQFFELPISDLKRMLRDGKPFCRVFESHEEKPNNYLTVDIKADVTLKRICEDPLKRRALSKAMRLIDKPFQLFRMYNPDNLYLLIWKGEEGRLVLETDYVRGTDDNLYPRLKYNWMHKPDIEKKRKG